MVVVLLALAGGAAYFSIPQPDLPEAAAALQSTATVTFRKVEGDLEFSPATGTATKGLVLYPGGKVDAKAYAPTAREIASEGNLVIVVDVPLHLAVLDIEAAKPAIERHPDVEVWAVGGHSLGGSMAAEFARRFSPVIDGLVLWASYSATDLHRFAFDSLVVYGSLDRGAARMSGAEALLMLPPSPTVVAIEGGNHEQMGWYTGQPNDPPATITRVEQQQQLVDATVRFMESLSSG